ncbi:MAG: hypothetical protein ABJO67_01790 [Pseudoruegeria sp.]
MKEWRGTTTLKKDLVKDGAINSMSFAAERKFALKHKLTKAMVSQILEHGSLLMMKGTTQTLVTQSTEDQKNHVAKDKSDF